VKYLYTAHSSQGKWVQGTLEAENESQARKTLTQRGLDVMSVQPDPGVAGWFQRLSLLVTPNLMNLALATRQLSVMLNSGVDIVRSLEVLRGADYGARLNLAWEDMSRSIQRGLPLSRALGRHPEVFSPVYRGLVKAGESSGGLVANLGIIADHLERDLRLRQKLKSALTYPAFVFLVCVVAILILTQKVLPTLIQGVFSDTGMTLPWMTRSVIFVGNALNSGWFYQLVLPGLLVLGLLIGHYLRTPGGRYRSQWVLRRLPLLSQLMIATTAARFARTMGALSGCGLPLMHSLELTDMVLADYEVSRAIDQILVGVENGESLTDLLRQCEAFPPLVMGFTELGEETGRLSSAYRHLADMLEEEIDLLLNTATAALEPLMIGVMGGLVGYVVIAMFLPLYQVLNAV